MLGCARWGGAIVWKLPRAAFGHWLDRPSFRAALQRVANERSLNAFFARTRSLRTLQYLERKELIAATKSPVEVAEGQLIAGYRRHSPMPAYIVARGGLVERQYTDEGPEETFFEPGSIWGIGELQVGMDDAILHRVVYTTQPTCLLPLSELPSWARV
jgi:hypothetical protein